MFDNDQERDVALTALQRKRDELHGRLTCLRARVTETDTCIICVDTIRHKTVTPCCANAFCLRCIHTWLGRRSRCPICRAPLRMEDLVTVTHGVEDTMTAVTAVTASTTMKSTTMQCQHRAPSGIGAGRSTHANKEAALDAVLRRCGVTGMSPATDGQRPSILVFAAYDDMLIGAGEALTRARMRYAHLKGNGATVNVVVADYRGGDTQALVANVRSYGSGLNLENTTDVILMHHLDPELERQVVGRAQRPGRTAPLHVWQLLHDTEG